jgi:membrane protease YdiL (CAAX protease family)
VPSFGALILLLLVGSLLLTALLAGLVKPGVDALVRSSESVADALKADPGTGLYDYGRVYRRLGMLVVLVVAVAMRRRLGAVRILGFGRDDARLRRYAAGLVAGLITWSAFIGSLVLLGRKTIELRAPDGLAGLLLGSAVSAVIVGLLEETVVRGYLIGGLRRTWPLQGAVLASSALYSLLHFMRATYEVGPGSDPWAGFRTLGAHLRALRPELAGGFVGLLLLGVVLACAYVWSRSIPFAAGLHSGWVFLIMIEKTYLVERAGTRGLYGEGGILAGPLGWLFLLLVLAGLYLALARGRAESP